MFYEYTISLLLLVVVYLAKKHLDDLINKMTELHKENQAVRNELAEVVVFLGENFVERNNPGFIQKYGRTQTMDDHSTHRIVRNTQNEVFGSYSTIGLVDKVTKLENKLTELHKNKNS